MQFGIAGMPVDPRRLAAIQVQIDALRHELEREAPEAHAALGDASKALKWAHANLQQRGVFLQIPPDYQPPEGLGGRCREDAD